MRDLAAIGPGARVIDVREPHEWASGHIAHAELIPLSTVPGRVDAFDGSPTFVVCRSGGRSAQACEFLSARGVDAVNVVGGMLAWVDARLETASGADGE